MIAKDSGTGKSFSGLANYLENGHKGEKQDRVAWFDMVNLDASTMREGAMVMKDAANENTRVEKPVYHFSINWHPNESGEVDRELGIKIAREALKDLGLEDHQAMIVAHKDTDHFHVHVLANRINPETDRAWVGSYTKVKLEESMARLSIEHGFEVVPGYHNSKDLGLEPPLPDISQSSEALRYEQRTDNPSFDTKVKIELPEVFEKANSWADLHTGLEEHGYQIQTRGRGLVVVDHDGHFAKASSIGREFSKASLENRYEEKFSGPGAGVSLSESKNQGKPSRETKELSPEERIASEIDRAVRRVEEYDQKAVYVQELIIHREEMLARTDDSFQKYQVMNDAKKDLESIFAKVFADPQTALTNFSKARRKMGIEAASEHLFENLKSYGNLKHGGVSRFMSSFVENEALKDREQFKQNLGAFKKTVNEIDKDRAGFNADLNERFDKNSSLEIKRAEKELKDLSRPKLEKAVLKAADKVKTSNLSKMPFSSELRRTVIKHKIAYLRGEDQDRKWAWGQGIHVDKNYQRFPSMPLNLGPEDKRAFMAVDEYAKALQQLQKPSKQMGDRRKAFERLRVAADRVIDQGARAEKHFSRFKIDKRVLHKSTMSGERGQQNANKLTPFVRSKSTGIQIKLSTILRMVGIPIPRLPMPKIPLSRSQGRDRGLGRELTRR